MPFETSLRNLSDKRLVFEEFCVENVTIKAFQSLAMMAR